MEETIMEVLSITEIAKVVRGNLLNFKEEIQIRSVSTRFRTKRPGYLYIFLQEGGKNADPTAYGKEAAKNGAAALIMPAEIECDIPQIIVKDTETALIELSKYYRSRFNLPVIAVTGSSGKTSTKDIIAGVLEEKYYIHKTPENFNSLIGVPVTVFGLSARHEISVMEVGMSSFGHIRRAVDIIRPSIGIITTIGTAHIGNLGSKDNILKAKLEVATFFDKNDILIVNGDDEYLGTLKDMPYNLLRISTRGQGDYNADDIVDLGEEGVIFRCEYKGLKEEFKINVPGKHNVYNALFAIAIGDLFQVDVENVKRGIENFKPEELRMNIFQLNNGVKLVLDCYTSEIDSMKAAIDALQSFKGSRKIAVLGDILGQGTLSEDIHREMGRFVRGKIDSLITIGTHSKYIFEESQNYLESVHFETNGEASLYIKNYMRKGDIILINGGRYMKLEEIADFLKMNQGETL
jgi:UDP-N-acetylmuramoyl-tripeptide--D-alanyl-D-alanine ligase